ncbi:hypothetical protein CN957_13170, partial [Bacillus cereus]
MSEQSNFTKSKKIWIGVCSFIVIAGTSIAVYGFNKDSKTSATPKTHDVAKKNETKKPKDDKAIAKNDEEKPDDMTRLLEGDPDSKDTALDRALGWTESSSSPKNIVSNFINDNTKGIDGKDDIKNKDKSDKLSDLDKALVWADSKLPTVSDLLANKDASLNTSNLLTNNDLSSGNSGLLGLLNDSNKPNIDPIKPPIGGEIEGGMTDPIKPPTGGGNTGGTTDPIKPPTDGGNTGGTTDPVKPPTGGGNEGGTTDPTKPPTGGGETGGG